MCEAHQASAVQSHSQCDLILVITQLQGEGWTRDPRVPSSAHLRVPQTVLLEDCITAICSASIYRGQKIPDPEQMAGNRSDGVIC